MNEVNNPARNATLVTQISNLPYRRFPIGGRSGKADALMASGGSQVGNLRNSRLEICATTELARRADF